MNAEAKPRIPDPVAHLEGIVHRQDEWRLRQCINLIASENVLSARARALLGSDFNHRYAEGHPGARYYEGTELIDEIEAEVSRLFRAMFQCSHAEVRTISGTLANEVMLGAFVKPGDTVMVNSVPAGGHISHQKFGAMGRITDKIEFFPRLPDGYRIDVNRAKDEIRTKKPKLVLLGKSLILTPEPVAELVEVCKEVGARLAYDGAHVLGLIAGQSFQAPLAEGAEVLTGSTHKTFFGPQRGVILSNLDSSDWKRIDRGTFPGVTSNHHLHTLPPLLMSAYEMSSFGKTYAQQVIRNAQAFAQALAKQGMDVQGEQWGYSRTHQVALNVAQHGGGSDASHRLLQNDIIVNKNMLPTDPPGKSVDPSGLRLGTQEMTRFGMKEPEMEEIARMMADVVVRRKEVKEEVHRFRQPFQRIHYSFDDHETRSSPL